MVAAEHFDPSQDGITKQAQRMRQQLDEGNSRAAAMAVHETLQAVPQSDGFQLQSRAETFVVLPTSQHASVVDR
eukprot:7406078-Prorocentrum_lima.AAC.1